MIYEGDNYAVQNPFDGIGERIGETVRNLTTLIPRDMVVTEAKVDQVDGENQVVARLNDGNEIRIPVDRLIEDKWGNTYEWVDGVRYLRYMDNFTISPRLTSPSFKATSTDKENMRSVEVTSPVRNGMTLQQIASWRRTFSFVVSAATGQAGRKREIICAVCPDVVAVKITAAFKSFAVRQQEWVIASLMLG